jgi:hypothetical protein
LQSAYNELETLKMKNLELESKYLNQDDPLETAEIIDSHLTAMKKSTCIEIATGDLSEI